MSYSSFLFRRYNDMNPLPRRLACFKCGVAGVHLTIGETTEGNQVVLCDKHLDTRPGIATQVGEVVDFNYYDCSETDKAWLNYCPIRSGETKPWGCEAYLSGGRGAALMCKDPSGSCVNPIDLATSGQARAHLSVDLLRNFFDNNLCQKIASAKKGGAA
jgi:hypothetical protein